MKFLHNVFYTCLIFASVGTSAAEQVPRQLYDYEDSNAIAMAPGGKMCHKSRLRPYEPSHMLFNKAQNDEWAIRAHYSFQYSIYPTRREVPCEQVRFADANLLTLVEPAYDIYFSYTGEFDFYAGTRPSGPVVNRTSNPALHARFQNDFVALS